MDEDAKYKAHGPSVNRWLLHCLFIGYLKPHTVENYKTKASDCSTEPAERGSLDLIPKAPQRLIFLTKHM